MATVHVRNFPATIYHALLSPKYTNVAVVLLLLAECFLVPFVIWKVKYTEIDWKAYMQEVEGFLNGTTDYYKLKGDTGPLVYPAGFVYIFSILYMITKRGRDIILAQYLFGVLYIVNLSVVFKIYSKLSKVIYFPVVLLPFVCLTAYRVHSIFFLRLFNDSIAVTILHFALLFLIQDKWLLGCILYSIAVSVKMNIMLYAPGLAFLLLKRFGLRDAIKHVIYCAIVEILLGLPFLLTHPLPYIVRAFDISRVFLYKWTVNWRFLPETIFVCRPFHISLLCAHLIVLLVFIKLQWTVSLNLKDLFRWKHTGTVSLQEIVYVMFTSNYIGICFARSLHYQFYVWYFYSLPLLVYWSQLRIAFSIMLLLVLEYSWNVYPSTNISSLLLHFVHFTILLRLLLTSNNGGPRKNLKRI